MLQLLQFRYSPYNEKLRWALDLKRVPHTRTPLLPGPHLAKVKKLTGQTKTPVLVTDDGEAIFDSSPMLQWLEQRYPMPPLLPPPGPLRDRVLSVEARFDNDIGPRARRVVLDTLLRSPRYFSAVFGAGHTRAARLAYGWTVPLAAPLVRRGNGIAGDDSIKDSYRAIDEGLSMVANDAAATGYLCGSSFTLADLTAASVLAMCVDPPDSPMARPQPMSAEFATLIERYRQHPGAEWVRMIYRLHRHAAEDFNGPSPY